MKYLRIIENMANDLKFNGFDFNTIIILVGIGVVIIYILITFFGYWMNPYHKHKMNQTIEEYYQHIKEEHPDIWEEYNLTDEGIKELIRKVREKENES